MVVRPSRAELAFAVADDYQGHGLGAALMRHLTAIARGAGLKEFVAEVLAETRPDAARVRTERIAAQERRDGTVIHVTLQL